MYYKATLKPQQRHLWSNTQRRLWAKKREQKAFWKGLLVGGLAVLALLGAMSIGGRSEYQAHGGYYVR